MQHRGGGVMDGQPGDCTWRGRVRRLLVLDIEAVQGASGHELVAVDGVDGPPRVARLPPRRHRLWLQLPHLPREAPLSGFMSNHGPEPGEHSWQSRMLVTA